MDVTKIEEKYARLPYPVMVTRTDGVIVFANDMAKKNFKSAKKNSNIAFILESSGLETLRAIVKTGEAGAVEFKMPLSNKSVAEYTGGLAIPEKFDGVDYITFLCVPPFNLIGGKDDYEAEIKRILEVYNKEKSLHLLNTLFIGKDSDLKDTFENYKKIAKIDKYINFCMQGLLESGKSRESVKNRDITDDLTLLKEVFNKYIVAQGYRIRYTFDDQWFYFEYNEWDFLVVNAIAASFALRNSVDRKIDYIFKTYGMGAASIEISFTPPEKIFEHFTKSLSMDITGIGNAAIQNGKADINYFDLYLAYTIAAKNKISFNLSSEDNKMKFVLDIKKTQGISRDTETTVKSGAYVSELENYKKMLAEFLLVDFNGEDLHGE